MDFHCIVNPKAGGESTPDFASFSYTLLCGVVNCQILIWPRGFDGRLLREIASSRSTPAPVDGYHTLEYPGASRIRQVVERQDAFSLSSKLPGRLSAGQLITPQSDVYEKDAKLCGGSPPGLRFAIRKKLIEALRKTCENTTVFACFPQRFSEFLPVRKSETAR